MAIDIATPVEPVTWRRLIEGEARRALTDDEYRSFMDSGSRWATYVSIAFDRQNDALYDAGLLPVEDE